MTAEELLKRYAAGERDFTGVDLSGVNLNIARLSECDSNLNILNGINLSGAKLISTNLEFVNLIGADLRSADLTDAQLLGADLSNADLRDAIFDNADLSANLTDADLRGSSMSGTVMYGGDLTRANLSDVINFGLSGEDVIFRDTIMSYGTITNIPI